MVASRSAVVVEVPVGITSDTLERLCLAVSAAAAERREVVCLVRGADLGVVDALARIELLCRSIGARWHIEADPPATLGALLELTGLGDALAEALDLRREMRGQPEPPEQ